jgi:hypothetical protein
MAVGLLALLLSAAGAEDRHLEQGLYHLRAGEPELAARFLVLYLDEEADVEVRATVARALLAMSHPLSPAAGQVVASNLEESIRAHLAFKRRLALDWRNRNFPVFP